MKLGSELSSQKLNGVTQGSIEKVSSGSKVKDPSPTAEAVILSKNQQSESKRSPKDNEPPAPNAQGRDSQKDDMVIVEQSVQISRANPKRESRTAKTQKYTADDLLAMNNIDFDELLECADENIENTAFFASSH